MRCKKQCLTLLVLSAMLLSSCSFIPQEEAIRTAPVIRTFTREAYSTVKVQRGDLIKTAKVSCKYVPVQTASLAFALSDEYIDKVMVQAGAVVEEGQLLAQLQLGDLEARIEDARNAIAELELRHTYQQKLYELEKRRYEINAQSMETWEQEEALEKLQEQYALRSQELTDALALQNLTLKSLEEDLAMRQIRAPFSGTVSRVNKVKDGDMSSTYTSMITLIDSTMSLFRASTEHWDRLKAGDEVEITVSKTTYRAIVTDEAALGLEPVQREPGKKADVYLVLSEPSFELEEGDVGTMTLVLEEHLDVLYLPKEVLSASAGQPIVYYQREDGMKAVKTVEAGVTIGDYTEILSGLVEGEEIIANGESAF